MDSDYDLALAGEFVLALMAFEIHDGGRAWKGYPWEVLTHLYEKGLISDPKTKAKSVVLSEEGEARAREAFGQFRPRVTTPPAADTSPVREKSSGLADLQLRQVEKLLEPLCALPDDPKVRSQLKKGFRVEGLSVILFESRPGFRNANEWREEPIAKFTYVKVTGNWKLFCMFRDLRWRAYELLPESRELAALVNEVRLDPTCIFWG